MIPIKFNLNFKKSPLDKRDYVLKSSFSNSTTNSDSMTDLSFYCTSIKNQRDVGSCTAHACVALCEFMFNKFFQKLNDDMFSERFVYYTTRVDIGGNPNDDSGAYLRDTMKALAKYGNALETDFPYVANDMVNMTGTVDIAEKPSEDIYNKASKYQISRYINISTSSPSDCLNDLRNLLKQGYAFVGGFQCFENIEESKNGLIAEPKGEIVGGHAVLFVGYDDFKKVFKFKNSWTSEWGDKGYGYLPYSYILNGNAFDFWTIFEQENNDVVFGIIKPNNRDSEIKRRMNEILKLISTSDKDSMQKLIESDESNSNLYSRDISMLKEFSNRLFRIQEQFQTVFERIKS